MRTAIVTPPEWVGRSRRSDYTHRFTDVNRLACMASEFWCERMAKSGAWVRLFDSEGKRIPYQGEKRHPKVRKGEDPFWDVPPID